MAKRTGNTVSGLTIHIQTDMLGRKPIRGLGDSLKVFVLHAFDKKTRRTPKRNLDVAARRYRQLMTERRMK